MIDPAYVLGRDNYKCQVYCDAELYEYYYRFKTLDDQGARCTENVVACCEKCFWLKAEGPYRFDKRSFLGRLIVITGPMFAEKSSTTKSLINKYAVAKKSYIWTKPDTDNRASNCTKTHNDEEIEAYIVDAKRPDYHLDELLKHDIVVFDEVQFYNNRILYVVHELLKANKMVIANGLKLTASRVLFGCLHYLLAEADDIIALKSVCNVCEIIDCATRTKPYYDIPTVRIGGKECYYAICPTCDGSKNEQDFVRKARNTDLRLGEQETSKEGDSTA